MAWISYLAGVFLVVFGLSEVFRTLLHPSGRGPLSRWTIRLFWRLGRRGESSSTLVAAGVVASIVTWVAVEIVGWALLILPLVPAGLSYSHGVQASAYAPFAEAIYFSMVTFSTVGYGDVVVTAPLLRMVAPLEALTGFAVVTASLSWFSQLYPALARRRALGVRLRAFELLGASGGGFPSGASGAQVLTVLAGDIAEITVDLQQNRETYYFREREADTTLPMMLIRLRRLIAMAEASDDGVLRWHAKVLCATLTQLSDVLRDEIGARDGGGIDAVILAVASDYNLPDAGRLLNDVGERAG